MTKLSLPIRIRLAFLLILYVCVCVFIYLIVLCSKRRLGVEEFGETATEPTRQHQQLLPSAGRQRLVDVVIDPDASVVAQTVDILLTQRTYTDSIEKFEYFFFFLNWAAVDVAWPTSTLFVVLQDGPAQFWQAILHAVDIDRRRILRTVTDRHPEHNRLTTCIIRKYCGVRKRERENEFAFKANNLIRFDMQIIVLLANWLASGSSTLLD